MNYSVEAEKVLDKIASNIETLVEELSATNAIISKDNKIRWARHLVRVVWGEVQGIVYEVHRQEADQFLDLMRQRSDGLPFSNKTLRTILREEKI